MTDDEYKSQTRGMAKAADLLYTAGFDQAAKLVVVEVQKRIKAAQ